jgi:predicted Zn-dependent protease
MVSFFPAGHNLVNHGVWAVLLLAQSIGNADLEALRIELSSADRTQARETARDLLTRAAADPRALRALGQLLGSHKELPLAEQAFSQAAQLQPDSFQAQFNLGLTLYQESKNDDAIRRLRAARALNPRHKGTLALLGVLYVGGGYPLDAVEVLEDAAKLDASDRPVALLLVEACHESYDFAKALAVARLAAARFPDSPEAQFRLGYELETAGAFDDAERAFQRAVSLREGYPEALLALGRLERKAGRYAEAAKHLQAVLRQEPAQHEARLELSKALVATRDLPRAHQILVALSREQPADPAPHALLAQIYAAQGQSDLSTREREQYLFLSGKAGQTGGMGGKDPERPARRFVP